MAQLFPKSANVHARVTILDVVVLVCGAGWATSAIYWSPYTTEVNLPLQQPIPFSHKHHVTDDGIDCRYCHTSVEKSSFAGIPSTETCMTCHSQLWTDAPVLASLRESLATGKPLKWVRVNDLPGYVYFNHSVHVAKGIGCSNCHGRIDQMPLTRKAQTLYMRWCLERHENPQKFVTGDTKVVDRGMLLDEASIPISEEVKGACEILGLDPLYVANEGKLLAIVALDDVDSTLKALRAQPLGRDAVVIGEVVDDHLGFVMMKTRVGGTRIVDTLSGEQLPRIC